jgi:hypothetical protein
LPTVENIFSASRLLLYVVLADVDD